MRLFLSVLVALITVAYAPAQAKAGQRQRDPKLQAKSRIEVPNEVPAALRRALLAVGKIRYSGTRIVELKSGPNRERHVEHVVCDGMRTRMEFPEGSALHGQVIVEGPDERRHFFPDRKELRVLPPRREEAFVRLAQMAKRKLQFSRAPGGSIAGLPSELVIISDPQGNPIQKLWIDVRSGMLLKRELYDRSGAVQASFEFTQIDLTPTINPTDFALAPKGVRLVTPETVLRALVRRHGFAAVRLPPDQPYRLEIARVQRIGDQQVLVQHYVGKGHRLSLFQLKAEVDPKRLGQFARGEVNTHSWQANGASFVLVGDVPPEELRDLSRRLAG